MLQPPQGAAGPVLGTDCAGSSDDHFLTEGAYTPPVPLSSNSRSLSYSLLFLKVGHSSGRAFQLLGNVYCLLSARLSAQAKEKERDRDAPLGPLKE